MGITIKEFFETKRDLAIKFECEDDFLIFLKKAEEAGIAWAEAHSMKKVLNDVLEITSDKPFIYCNDGTWCDEETAEGWAEKILSPYLIDEISDYIITNHQLVHKLVRDKIPDIIRSSGGEASYKTIKRDMDFSTFLAFKLHEECIELNKEVTECLSCKAEHYKTDIPEDLKDRIMNELIDVLEVTYTIGDLFGVDRVELLEMMTRKAAERGEFRKRILLNTCSKKVDNNGEH